MRSSSREGSNRRAEWRALKTACAQVRDVIDTSVYSHFSQFVIELERIIAKGDQRGFYRHLKGTVGMEGSRVREEQYIRDEAGVLLRDKGEIRSRWVRFFKTLLNTKSPKLDPTIIEQFPARPVELALGDPPTMHDVEDAIRGMANEKAVGPDSLPV